MLLIQQKHLVDPLRGYLDLLKSTETFSEVCKYNGHITQIQDYNEPGGHATSVTIDNKYIHANNV